MKSDIKQIFGNLQELKKTLYGDTSVDPSTLPLDADAVMYYAKPKSDSGEIVRSKNFLIIFSPCEKFEDNIEPNKSPFVDSLETYNVDSVNETNISFSQSFLRFLSDEQLKDNVLGQTEKWNFNEIDTDVLFIRDKETRWYTNTIKTLAEEQDQPIQDYTERMLEEFVTDVIFDELQNYPEIEGEKRQVALYGGHEGAGYGALRALLKIGEVLKNDQALGIDDTTKINYVRIFNFTVYAYNFQTDILYEEQVKNAPIDEFVIRQLYPDLFSLPADGYKILRTEYENISEEIRNLYDLSDGLDLYLSDTSLPLKLVVGGGHPVEGIENEAQSKFITLSESEEWSNHLLYRQTQYTNGLAEIVDSETGSVSWRFNVIYKENLKNNIIQELSLRLMNQVPAEQGTLGGRVVDGYIANATGRLLSFTGNKLDDGTLETKEVATFTTDDAGRWSVTLRKEEIPATYKLEFIGGTDILTGEEYNGTLTSIGSIDIGSDGMQLSNENVNVSPISTIKSKLLENLSSGEKLKTKDWINLGDNGLVNDIIENAFGLTEEDVNSDYIFEQNPPALQANVKLNLVKNIVTSVFNENVDDDANKITHDDFISSYVKTIETGVTNNLELNGNINETVSNLISEVITNIASVTQISVDNIDLDNIIELSQNLSMSAMSGMDDVSSVSVKAPANTFISNNFLISAKKMAKVNNYVTKLLGTETLKSSSIEALKDFGDELESIKSEDVSIDDFTIVSIHGHAEKIIRITLDSREQNPWDPVFQIDDPNDDDDFLCYEYVFLTKHKDASFAKYDNNVWVGQIDQDLNLEYGSSFDDLPMANGTPIISKTRNKKIKLPRIMRGTKEYPAEIYAEDDYKLKCIPYVRRVTKNRYSKFVGFVPTDVYSNLYYSPITRFQGDDSETEQTSNFKEFNFTLEGGLSYGLYGSFVEIDKVKNDFIMQWSHRTHELINLNLKIQKWKFDFYIKNDEGTAYTEEPNFSEIVESANIKQETYSAPGGDYLRYSYKMDYMNQNLVVGEYKLVISAIDAYSENHRITASDSINANYETMSEDVAVKIVAKSRIDEVWNAYQDPTNIGVSETANLNGKLRFAENNPNGNVYGSFEIQTPLHEKFNSIEYSIRTINTKNDNDWQLDNIHDKWNYFELEPNKTKANITREDIINYLSNQGINAEVDIGIFNYEFELPAISNEIYLESNSTEKSDAIYYYVLESFVKMGPSDSVTTVLEEGDLIDASGMLAYDFRNLPDLQFSSVRYNSENDKYEIQLNHNSYVFELENETSYNEPNNLSKNVLYKHPSPSTGSLFTGRVDEFSISINNEEYISIKPSLFGIFTIETIPTLAPTYIKLKYSSSNPYISDKTLVLNIDIDVSNIKFGKVKSSVNEEANYYSAHNYSEVGENETGLYLEWDDVTLKHKPLVNNSKIYGFSDYKPILKYRIQFNDDEPYIVSSNKLNISEYLAGKNNIVGDHEIKVSATDDSYSETQQFSYNLKIDSGETQTSSVVFGKGLGLDPLPTETGGDFEFQWHFKDGDYTINNSNRLKHYELYLNDEKLTRIKNMADPEKSANQGRYVYEDFELDYFDKNTINTYLLQVDESKDYTLTVVGVLHSGLKTEPVSHTVVAFVEPPETPSNLNVPQLEASDFTNSSDGKIPFGTIPSISWAEHDNTNVNLPNVTHYSISLGSYSFESESIDFEGYNTGTLSFDFDKIEPSSDKPILDANGTYAISIVAINELMVESEPAILNFDVYYTDDQLAEIESTTRTLIPDDGLSEELVSIRDGFFPSSIEIPTPKKYPNVQAHDFPGDMTMLVTMEDPFGNISKNSNTLPTKSYIENSGEYDSNPRYYRLLTYNGNPSDPKWNISIPATDTQYSQDYYHDQTRVYQDTKFLLGDLNAKFVVLARTRSTREIKSALKLNKLDWRNDNLLSLKIDTYVNENGDLKYKQTSENNNVGVVSGYLKEFLNNDFDSPNVLDDFYLDFSLDLVTIDSNKQSFSIVIGEPGSNGSFLRVHEKIFNKHDAKLGNGEYTTEKATTSYKSGRLFPVGMPRSFNYSEIDERTDNVQKSPVVTNNKFKSAVKSAISRNYKDFICVAKYDNRALVITLADESAPKGGFKIFQRNSSSTMYVSEQTIQVDDSLIGGEKVGVVVSQSGDSTKVILGARSFIKGVDSQSMNDLYTTSPSFQKNSSVPHNRRIDSTFSDINESGYTEKKEWVLHRNNVVKYYKIYAKTQITDDWYLIKEGSFDEIIQSTELKRFPSFRDKSYSSKWEFDFSEDDKLKIINKRKPNKYSYQEMIMVKEYTDDSLNHRKIIKFCSNDFHNLTLSDEQITYREIEGYSPIAKVYTRASETYDNITWGSLTTTDSSMGVKAIFDPKNTHPRDEKTPPKICARKIVSSNSGNTIAISIHTDELIDRYNREDIAYLKVFVKDGVGGYKQKGQGISYLDCNEYGDFDISGDGNILVVSANKLTTQDCVKVFNYDSGSNEWILSEQNKISMDRADKNVYSATAEFTDLDGVSRKSHLFGSEVSISTNGNIITVNAPGARRMWINSRCNISGGVFVYEYKASLTKYKKIPTPFSSFLNAFKHSINKNYTQYISTMQSRIDKLGITDQLTKIEEVSLFNIAETYLGLNLGGVIEWQDSDKIFNEMGPKGPTPAWYYETPSLSTLTSYGYASNIPVKPNDFIKTLAPLEAVSFADSDNSQILPKNQYYRVKSIFDSADPLILYAVADETQEIDFADLSYLFVLISVVINATEEDFLIKRTDRVDKWELVLPTSDITSYVDDVPPFEPIFKSNLINYTTNKTPTWQWNPVNKKVNNTDIVQTLLEEGASYNYYLNDNSDTASLETTTNLEFTPFEDLNVGTHKLYLSAKDEANNESGQVTYDIQVVDVNNLIVSGIKYFGTDSPEEIHEHDETWYVSPSNLLDITWNKLADDIANAYKTIYYRVVLYKLAESTLDEELVFESQLFTDNNFTMNYKVPMGYYKIGVGIVAVDEDDNTLNSDYVNFMVKTNEQSLPHIRSCLPFNLEVKDSSESVTFNEVSVRKHNGSVIAKHPTDNVNPHPWYFHKPIYYASVANDINKQVNSLKITVGIAEEWLRANQITESNSVVFVGIYKVSHGTIPSGYEEDKYHGVFANSTSAITSNNGDDSFAGSVIDGFTIGKNASEYLTDGIAYFNGRDRSPELNYISTQDYDPEKNYKYPLTHKIRFVDVDVPIVGSLNEGIYEIRVKVANREGETYDYPIGDLSNTYFYDQSTKQQVSNYASLYSEAFDNATAVDFDVTRLVLKNTTKTESDIQIKVNSNDLLSFEDDLVTAERNTDIKIEWTDLEPSIDSRADSLLYPFTYKVRFTHDELESALSTTSILRKYQNSLKINSYYTTNNDTTQTNYTSDLLNYEYILPGDFLKETLTATVDTIGVHIDVYHFNAKIGTREFLIHIDSNTVELVEHPQHSSENGILYNQDHNLVMKWAYSLEISDPNIFQSYSLKVLRRESTDKMYWYYSEELSERVWGYSTQEIIHEETRLLGENLNYMQNPPSDVDTDFYDVFEYTDSDVPNIGKNYIYSLEMLVDTTTGSNTGHIYEFTSSHEKESTRPLADLTLSYNESTQILDLGLGGESYLSLYDKNKINRNLVELFSITGSGENLTSEKIGEETFLYDPETGNQSLIDLKNHFALEIGTIEIKVTSYLLDNDVRNHIRTASYQFDNAIENKGFVVSNIEQKYNSKINLRAYDTLYNRQNYNKESFYESAWRKNVSWNTRTGFAETSYYRINNNEKPDWVCVDPNVLDTEELNAKFSFMWDALSEPVESYTIKLRTYKFTHSFEDVLGKRGSYRRLYWGEYRPDDSMWYTTLLHEPNTSMLNANFSQISNYEKKLVKIEEFTVNGNQTEFEIPTDYINSVLTTHENTNLFKGEYSVVPKATNNLHKKQLKNRYHWGFISELEIVAKRLSDGYTTSPVFSESFMLGDVKTKIKVVDDVFVDVNDSVTIAVDFIKHPFYNRNNSLEIINKYKIVPTVGDHDSVEWESWGDNRFGYHTITKTFTEMGFFTLLINSTDNLGNVTEAQVEINVLDKIYFNNLNITDYSEPKKIPVHRGLLSEKYNEYAFAFIGIDEISKRVNKSITHHPGKSELEQYTKSNTTNSYEYKMGDFIRFNDDYTFDLPEYVGAHEQVFNKYGNWEVDYMDQWYGEINSPIEYSKYRTNGILPNQMDAKNLPRSYREKIYAIWDHGFKNYHKPNLVNNKMKEISEFPGGTYINTKANYWVVHDFQVNSPQDVSSHDTTKKYGVVYGVNKTDTETELYVFLNGGYQTTLFPPEIGTPLETTPNNKIDYRQIAYYEIENGGYGQQIGGCIKIKISDADTGWTSGLWDVVSPITTDESLEASGLYKDVHATYDDWTQGDLIKLNNDTQLKEVYIDYSGEQSELVELENTITMQANKLIGLQFEMAEKFLYRFYSSESEDFKLYALPNDVEATRWVSDPNRIVIEPGYPKHPQIIVNNIDNFTSSGNVFPSWKYSHDTSPGGDEFRSETYYERHLYKKNNTPGEWEDITESLGVVIIKSGFSNSDNILLFKSGTNDNGEQIPLQNGTYKFTIQTIFKHKSDASLDRKSTIAESRELTINLEPPANISMVHLTEIGGYEYKEGESNEALYPGSTDTAQLIEADKVKWKWNLLGFTSEDGHYEVTLKEYIRNDDATDGSGEFVEILKQEVNATQFAYDYVKIDSIYRIEVVAVNLQGVSSNEPAHDTIRMTDLTPPNSVTNIKFETPTFPVSFGVEQFFNDIPTWSWDAVEDADEYSIELEYAVAEYDVSELHIGHTNNSQYDPVSLEDPSGQKFTDTKYTDADGNEQPEPYYIPTIETDSGWSPPSDVELLSLRNVKTNSFTPPKSLPRGKFWRIKVTAIDSYGNSSNAITSASYHLPFDIDNDDVADFYDYWKSDPSKSHNVSYLESLEPNLGLTPRVGNLVRIIQTSFWSVSSPKTIISDWNDYNNPYMSDSRRVGLDNSGLQIKISSNHGNWQSSGIMPTYAIVTWVNPNNTIFRMRYGPYELNVNTNINNFKLPELGDDGNIIGKYVFITSSEYKIPLAPTNLSHNEEPITVNKKPKFTWSSSDTETFILKINDEVLNIPNILKTSENNFEFTHSEDLLGIIKFSVIARLNEFDTESEEVSVNLTILKDTDGDKVADDREYFIYDANDTRTKDELDALVENHLVPNDEIKVGDIMKVINNFNSSNIDDSSDVLLLTRGFYFKITNISSGRLEWHDVVNNKTRFFRMSQRKKTDASTKAENTEKWQIVSEKSVVNELVVAQQSQATAEANDSPISDENKVAVIEYIDDLDGTPEVGSVVQFKKTARRPEVGNPTNKYLFRNGDYAKIKREFHWAWLITVGSVENEESFNLYIIPKTWMGSNAVLQKIKE